MIAMKSHSAAPLKVPAALAEDLMTANPMSIEETLTAEEARNSLIHKGISAAPVIDAVGHPVGVVSQTDLFIHDRERPSAHFCRSGQADTLVREVMTEGVFAVGRHAPIERVIGDMCELNVHRVFVVDAAGVLVGVVSAMDVLRHIARSSRDREGHR